MSRQLYLLLATALALTLFAAPARASFGFLPGSEGFGVSLEGQGGLPDTEAGSHPVALRLDFAFNSTPNFSDGDLRDLSVELPPGLIENPTATPYCSQADFLTPRTSRFEASLSGESCPQSTQVGTITLTSSYAGGETRTFGLFNLAPPPGAPAELGANPYGAPLLFVPAVRQAEGEYGLTLAAHNLPQLLSIERLGIEVWGTPWSLLHDTERGECLNEVEPAFGWAKCQVGRPAKIPTVSYLTLPTSCEGALSFRAEARSWQDPAPVSRGASAPALEACAELDFAPMPAAQLSDPRTTSPSGYGFDIDVDTSGYTVPSRRAPSPVRRAVIHLPAGLSINPSVGAGLGVCTPAQFAAEGPTSPPGAGCPNESKIGDFTVKSPIVSGRLEEGAVFLAAPYDNPSGALIGIYLIARSIDRGLLVKLSGELRADPTTGDLTAVFDRLPQLPYSQLRIHFREGQRSPLATPGACGPISTEADLTPWRDPGLIRHFSLPAQISAGYGGGPCPSGPAPFAPGVAGGSLNSQAGAYAPFYLHLSRTDPEQEITSYSATFPPGLLGKLAGVPYCPDAALAAAALRSGVAERDAPSCPAASLIGHTSTGYGVGTVLTYAPGDLYLAGPYRGAQLSVVAIDSALVGPFDLGVVVVRSAIRIDPATTRASIDATGTDPIPHIIKGIPIHLRDIRVFVDRPGFTLNPTNCTASTLSSTLSGSGAIFGDRSDDVSRSGSARYQAFNCGALGFKPRLSMRLRGDPKRTGYPALRVEVRPRPGHANLSSAQVTLPASLFLDQSRIDSICTRKQFAAASCPPGSQYGKVSVTTPLLDQPLRGAAYLRSSDRTLPDLVFALRGSGFEVDLPGRIDSRAGGLRGTFTDLPDAPFSRFVLQLFSARRGLLQSGENLCSAPQVAQSRLISQSNLGRAARPELKVACKKKSRKAKKDPNRGGKGGGDR